MLDRTNPTSRLQLQRASSSNGELKHNIATAHDSMWGPAFLELVEALPGIAIVDRSSVNALDDLMGRRGRYSGRPHLSRSLRSDSRDRHHWLRSRRLLGCRRLPEHQTTDGAAAEAAGWHDAFPTTPR
jgi:hypothetical protein